MHNVLKNLASHLSILERHDVGELCGTQHRVVALDRSHEPALLFAKELVALVDTSSEVLPGLVRRAEVGRTLEGPDAGTRRVCHFDEDVRDVKDLQNRRNGTERLKQLLKRRKSKQELEL